MLFLVAVITAVGFFVVGEHQKRMRLKNVESTLRYIHMNLDGFRELYDRYPTTEEGLQILTFPPSTPFISTFEGTVDGQKWEPIIWYGLWPDPWGKEYLYESASKGMFTLKSTGPDRKPGDDDIVRTERTPRP